MTIEPVSLPATKERSFGLLNYPLTIETGINGKKVPIPKLARPDHYHGPEAFDQIVHFRSLVEDLGMRDSSVSDAEMWTSSRLPPKGITILEFNDEKIKGAIQKLSFLANTESYKDPIAKKTYYELIKDIYSQMPIVTGIDPKSTVFVGLLRAGGYAGEMLGIPVNKQVRIITKRLRLEEGNGGFMSVGIDLCNPEDLQKMNGKDWLIADPAGATYVSILANTVFALSVGVKPARLLIWNTATTHKGSEFMLNMAARLGIDCRIVAGGYSPRMNDSYYLLNSNRQQCVGDAGDWLDPEQVENTPIVPKA